MVRELDEENGRVIWANHDRQNELKSPSLAAYVTVGGDYDSIDLSVQNGPTVMLGLDKDGGFMVTVFRHKCRVIIESNTLDDEDTLIECLPAPIESYFPWAEIEPVRIRKVWREHCKKTASERYLMKDGYYRLPSIEELVDMGREGLLSVKGIGENTVNKIGEILKNLGYKSWITVD